MSKRALGTKMLINSNIVAGLTSIGGLELMADTREVTNLLSPDGYREFEGGLKDGGEVSVSGYFEPGDADGQIALYDNFDLGALLPFNIIFPQGAAWNFNGVVTGFTTGAELEDNISFEATIKVSGKPNLSLTVSAGLTNLVLTGAGGTLAPVFAAATRYYSFAGVTAASVTVTATGAGQKIKLFVDGVYKQDLASGSASEAILAAGSKKVTIMANEAGKVPKIYEIVVIKAN